MLALCVSLAALLSLFGSVNGLTESVSWVTSGKTSCSNAERQLLFVFDEFSVAQYEKAVGAFAETWPAFATGAFPETTKLLNNQLSTCFNSIALGEVAAVSAENIQEVIAEVSKPTGTSVIRIHANIQSVSTTQDLLMSQAVNTILKVAPGSVSITFLGEKSTSSSAQDRRSLQTSSGQPLIRMAPDTFVGLLFLVAGHLLLIFTLCCCMDSIEAQSKYARQYPLKGKELN